MRKVLVALAVLALLCSAGPASASVIQTINSQAGPTTGVHWEALVGDLGVGPIGTTGDLVAINPHSAWDPNGAAIWVSYANTGVTSGSIPGPFVLTPRDHNGVNGPLAPIISVYQTINASDPYFNMLTLSAWADDTTLVYLIDSSNNETKIIDHQNFGTQSTCEVYSPSCPTGLQGTYSGLLAPGTYTLRFDVFQIGQGQDNNSNPFGLKYEGQIATPEPGSMLLLGTGLFGLAGAIRRRVRK